MKCKSFVPKHGQYAGQEIQSELFAQLLEHYLGDANAANKAYEVAFSNQFMDFFGGDWTSGPVDGVTAYTEPPMESVLNFIESTQVDYLLAPFSEETEKALQHTELAKLIIPELGVTRQSTIVNFLASLVTKNILESDQKKFTEEELFGTVQEYFRAKLREVKESDPAQATELRKILRNFPQLTRMAKSMLSKLNQVTITESQEGAMENNAVDEASMERRSYEDNATFKIDGKVTMSARLRRFFSFIPDAEIVTKDGQRVLQDKESFIPGITEIVPFDVVYNTLIALLSGQRADFDGMVNYLKGFENAFPWLRNVVEKLEEADSTVQTEFVVAMSKHYVSMKFIMWNVSADGHYGLSVFDANANAIARQIQDDWYINFMNAPITIADPNDGTDNIMDPVIKDRLIKQFESWFKTIEGGRFALGGESVAKMKAEGKQWLAEFGVELSDKAWGEITGMRRERFAGLFRYAGGPFRILYENLKSRGSNPISVDNPLAETALKKLANIEAKYSTRVLSNSHRAGGETIYSHALNKYNVKRMRDLKTDPATVQKLRQISFSKESMWLKMLEDEFGEEETPFADNFALHYMSLEAIKQLGGIQGPEMKATDSAEHEVTKIGLFQNKGNSTAYFLYPTMSDKTSMMVVEVPRFEVELDENRLVNGDTVDMVYSQMVLPEINRILFHQERGAEHINDKGMAAGWHLFYMLPEMNNLEILYNEDGTLRADVLSNEDTVKAMKKLVKDHINSLVAEKIDEWAELGIGQEIKDENNVVVKNMTFLDRHYLVRNAKKIQAKKPSDKTRFAATDFVVNYLLANANVYHTIIGDPAQFFKSGKIFQARKEVADVITDETTNQDVVRNHMTDEQRIGIIEDTFLNVGKRLAGDMAPGYDLNDERNNSFKTLFIKDTALVSDLLPMMEKLGLLSTKLYKEIESADAQEFTTLAEHLYVMRQTGKMKAPLYEKVRKIIDKEIKDGNHYYSEAIKKALTEEEYAEFKGLVYQPMKPVYVNNVTDVNDNIDRRTYVKSSSFALSPELTSGHEMDKIRIAMEKNSIDRLAFNTAIKVGAPIRTPKLVNADSKGFDGDVLEALTNNPEELAQYVRTLPREGFRIQQEVPYDATKKEINVGTQERKLLFNNILGNPAMEALFRQYNGLYKELFTAASRDLMYELSGSVNEDGSYNPVDVKKLRKMLVEEAQARNYPINDLYALDIDEETGQFVLPLWASNSADRIQALLNSIVDNRVRKMTFPGKSLVLGTQEGFKMRPPDSLDKDEKSGIVYVEGYNPEEGLKGMRIEDGKFKPGQVLMPFKFKDNAGNVLKAEDFAIEKDGKMYLDTSKFDKELLKVFGFRIPTQGHNSMGYFEIVGFLPKTAGDLIVAPRELVAQMGSDFDVDKLYLYMHHTDHQSYDESTLDAIAALKAEVYDIQDQNPEVFVKKGESGRYDAVAKEFEYIKEVLQDAKEKNKYTTRSINAKVHMAEGGIDAGDRLITSFRAAVTDIVGNHKFYNPDQVDFHRLKTYIRNMIDNNTDKLARIDASSINPIEGVETLDSWITDEEELMYAKATKQILIKFNKQRQREVSALYDAKNRLHKKFDEIREIAGKRNAITDKIKQIRESNRKPILKKVDTTTNFQPMHAITALGKEMGLTLPVPRPNGTFYENVPSIEDLSKDGIGPAEARDMALEFIQNIQNHITEITDQTDRVAKQAQLSILKRRVFQYFEQKKARAQNRIIDIHFEVMSSDDPNVQRQIHEPLAYGDLKGRADFAARIDRARKARTEAGKTFSPMSDGYQKQKFMNAMAGRVGGVGVFSLDSVLNTVFQQAQTLTGRRIYAQTDPKSKQPLQVRFGTVATTNGDLSGKYVLGSNTKFKSDVIAAFQSAAVDNEKEQVMDKINVNNYTYDVIRILAQLGFEENVIAPFISQDIIFEYVDRIGKATNSLQDFDPAAKEKVIGTILKERFSELGMTYNAETELDLKAQFLAKSEKYGPKELMALIEQGDKHAEYKEAQLALFIKFLELSDYGVGLKRIQSAINTDSAGIGKSLHASMAKADAVAELDRGLINGGETALGVYERDGYGNLMSINFHTINGFATEQALFLNNSLWRQFFPFDRGVVMGIMEEIMTITDKSNASYNAKAELYDRIWNHMKSYVFSGSDMMGMSTENGAAERKRLLFDVVNNEGDQPVIEHASLARIVHALKDSDYFKQNAFLNRLKPRIGKGTLPSTVTFNASTAENFDELNLYTSFMEMIAYPEMLGEFNGKPMTSRDLARELILYSYITGGIQEATQFVKFIPVEYLQKIGFAKTMNELSFTSSRDFGYSYRKETPYEYSTFTRQYIQHNPGSVKRGDLKHMATVNDDGNLVSMTDKNIKNTDRMFITPSFIDEYSKDFEGDSWLVEFIAVYDDTVPQKYHLFERFDKNEYRRIPVLGTRSVGKKHVSPILEYSFGSTNATSSVNNFTQLTDPKKKRNLPTKATSLQKNKVLKNVVKTKPVSNRYADELDMDNGGIGVVQDILDNIVSLTDNVGYREYAEQILEIIGKTQPNWSVAVISDPEGKFVGRMTPTKDGVQLTINVARIDSRSHAEEVILHELTHALTSRLLTIAKENPEAVTSQQRSIIQRLEKLQKAYRAEVTKEYGLSENEDIKAHLLKQEGMSRREMSELYGGENLKEFVAMVMTSPDMQKKLNDRGLFERFLNIINDLLTALGIKMPTELSQAVIKDITTLIQLEHLETPAPVESQPSHIPGRLSSKEKPLKMFVDGSDIKGTGKIGFGIHLEHGGKAFNMSGHYNTNKGGLEQLSKELGMEVTGFPSNGVMELYGSLRAIQNTPLGEYIEIHQDLEGVQLWILSRLIMRITDNDHLSEKAYKKDFWGNLTEEQQKSITDQVKSIIDFDENLMKKKVYGNEKYSKGYFTKDPVIRMIADKIVDEILRRPGKISYFWVPAHVVLSGKEDASTKERIEGNNAADIVAKSEETFNTLPDLFSQTVMKPKETDEQQSVTETEDDMIATLMEEGIISKKCR